MTEIADSDSNKGGREFVAQVARYYRDFLETDFRKTRAPARQVRVRDANGGTLGFNVRRYPDLLKAILTLLEKPFSSEVTLPVRRNQYTATISRNVQILLKAQIDDLDDDSLRDVVNRCVFTLKKQSPQGQEDFDRFVENAIDLISVRVMQNIVAPLVKTLEGALKATPSINAEELLYEIEDDIAEHIIDAIRENLPEALVDLVHKDDLAALAMLLSETIGPEPIKEFLVDFFGNLATGDAYEELLGLEHTLRLNETLEAYLYLLDLIVKPHQFPIAFLPIQLEKIGDKFILHLDNRLFFNRRALKYVVDHHPDEGLRVPGPPTNDRIHFLVEASPLSLLEDTTLALTNSYRLPDRVDPGARDLNRSDTLVLSVTNAMHICAFSKSEEAIVNDYEQILIQSDQEGGALSGLFNKIINGCIIEEPKSARPTVEKAWEETPRDERLIYESPVPLNEEQRKLLLALQNTNCRYAVVEGPPGTGKSHTITAIVFDAIMRNRSVLVLSDKNEALDVVEDKLTQTLNQIRPGDDFQNPILRLGRSSGTYAKILKKATRDRIQRYFQAAKSHRARAKKTVEEKTKKVKGDINATVEQLSAINIREIIEYESLLTELNIQSPESLEIADRMEIGLRELTGSLKDIPQDAREELVSLAQQCHEDLPMLMRLVKQRLLEAQASQGFGSKLSLLGQFEKVDPEHIHWLKTVSDELISMRNPIFGYLFCRTEVKTLAEQFAVKMPLAGLQPPHKRRKNLQKAATVLTALNQQATKIDLPGPMLAQAIERLRQGPVSSALSANHIKLLVALYKALLDSKSFIEAVWPNPPTVTQWVSFGAPLRDTIDTALRLIQLHIQLHRAFGSVPRLDLQKTQSELQHEHTADLAHRLDENLLTFVTEYHALATTLKTLIQQRQPFPKDRFELLKNAFPCIIASIREFADYIPLEADLIDIVVIDEASQVSIAQALPALLRAKQVVVLGDEQQFANVKTSTASKSVNQGYMNDLEKVFRDNFDADSERLERMRNFDVRTSILRFFDLIKNFDVMLRKHFRGYSELISFSSKYFYDYQLQAIRIRARPISEVLKFNVLGEEELPLVTHRNANQAECNYISEQLEAYLELDEPPSVGIITPFREQQKLATRELLFEHSLGDDFRERLNLKIMTFDTCQGEERDLIFYTMAATREHDRLNYIFPTELRNYSDGADRIKAQRLNVGFSRAKETIHFVLSKPIEDYKGTVREVLRHYEKEKANSKALPSVDQVDPKSPMEAQLLHWLRDTAFYRENADRLEVVPQFPIGDYLKQLDPYYEHPRYRVDFLLLYAHPSGRKIPVIIEYDGFREHFKPGAPIDASNYQYYYRDEDVERQFVLESYGYNFLRVNRFNLGKDPVQTLSDRLFGLIATRVDDDSSSEHTEAVNMMVNALESGEAKVCNKCGQAKPLNNFKRPELKSGYGRYCNSCHRRRY